MTLRDALRGRDNGLNLVRLVLAALVVVGHSWPIGGFGAAGFMLGLRNWAVYAFFAISGYLIAGSRLRLGWVPFIVRRAARSLPGYWTCLFVTAFGAAPLLAVAHGTDFEVATAVSFVRSNWWLWMSQATIGDTVARAPFPLGINGSLWTLPYEALAYILVGLLLGSAIIRQRLAVSSALMFASVVGAHAAAVSAGFPEGLPIAALRLGGFFAAGMVVYAISDRVVVSWRVAAAATTLMVLFGVLVPSVELLALPLAVILLWCGVALPVHWGAKNDYSYGVYIYAFPAQQLLVSVGVNRFGPWVLALLSFVVVLPVAVLSWWFVERPALRLAPCRLRPSKPESVGVVPPVTKVWV